MILTRYFLKRLTYKTAIKVFSTQIRFRHNSLFFLLLFGLTEAASTLLVIALQEAVSPPAGRFETAGRDRSKVWR